MGQIFGARKLHPFSLEIEQHFLGYRLTVVHKFLLRFAQVVNLVFRIKGHV